MERNHAENGINSSWTLECSCELEHRTEMLRMRWGKKDVEATEVRRMDLRCSHWFNSNFRITEWSDEEAIFEEKLLLGPQKWKYFLNTEPSKF